MADRFDGTITLAAATATNLLTALQSGGYTGTARLKFLWLQPRAGDIYRGIANTVTNANGRKIKVGGYLDPPGSDVDASQVWLYSVGGETVDVSTIAAAA